MADAPWTLSLRPCATRADVCPAHVLHILDSQRQNMHVFLSRGFIFFACRSPVDIPFLAFWRKPFNRTRPRSLSRRFFYSQSAPRPRFTCAINRCCGPAGGVAAATDRLRARESDDLARPLLSVRDDGTRRENVVSEASFDCLACLYPRSQERFAAACLACHHRNDCLRWTMASGAVP